MTVEERRNLVLRDVLIEGLKSQRTEVAEAELRRILMLFEKSSLELVHDVNLSIVLSHEMEGHVDRVRDEYGFEDLAPYSRLKSTVSATGITLWAPARPPLEATIVLDAAPWADDHGENTIRRVFLLGHELGHVLQQARDAGFAWDGGPRTHNEAVKQAAAILRDEIDADITADTICKLVLRDDRGEGVSPNAVMAPWFIGPAFELFERLRDFAEGPVQTYCVTSVGLEDLYPTAGPLIGELILVLGHAAVLFAAGGGVKPLREALGHSPGFRAYLEPDWDEFLRALLNEDQPAAEAELIRIYEAILERLGLVVEDRPNGGLYVHVHEPVLCDDEVEDE